MMGERERAARERAQTQVARMTRQIKASGIGLQPSASFQRCAILDTQILTLIDLVGKMVPGGVPAVWDAIAKRAGETADAWEAKRIQIADKLPGSPS